MTTVSGLDAAQTYEVTLTGEQVELIRRYLVNARTFTRFAIQERPHPHWLTSMQQEIATIEAILDVLPIGEIALPGGTT